MGFFSRIFGDKMHMKDISAQENTCVTDPNDPQANTCTPKNSEPSPFLADECAKNNDDQQ